MDGNDKLYGRAIYLREMDDPSTLQSLLDLFPPKRMLNVTPFQAIRFISQENHAYRQGKFPGDLEDGPGISLEQWQRGSLEARPHREHGW